MTLFRKFYDAEYIGCGGLPVINQQSKLEKVIIECECGTHLLHVQCETDIYENSDKSSYTEQTIYLAMFGYGNQIDSIWRRIKTAWKYLKSGKMHNDQLCLNPEEAKKLSDFLVTNILPTQ